MYVYVAVYTILYYCTQLFVEVRSAAECSVAFSWKRHAAWYL
jgi:hypothetical protein